MSEEIVLCDTSYSIRAVSLSTVLRVIDELPDNGKRTIDDALEFICDKLVTRVAYNAHESLGPLVYFPSKAEDPFIFAIPLNQKKTISNNTLTPGKEPLPIVPKIKDTLRSNTNKEFEDVLFNTPGKAFSITDLDKESNGEYINKEVQAIWIGFCLYHNELTKGVVKSKERYEKTLGRYVIGKVNKRGIANFVTAPFRHQTRQLAFEEAARLSEAHNGAFGVFRCMAIVGSNNEIE